ncbi:MAG TPA: site-2 protease family protein [Candidatus Latescibacteria bacterium]|nr:site-2 protease family protein [Candidatus Latescibacterota bacterium]HOS65531.1 site-2 protease family protein [Candidatus Latescibacterota bacterium]
MLGFGLDNLPYLILVVLPVGIMAVTIHEVSHGYIAWKLGDPTAHYTGRLTLNPIAHIDPIGALMLILVGFGWAKPVPVNPGYFKNPRRGMMWVALAGPVSNILFAVVFALVLKAVFAFSSEYTAALFPLLRFGIVINVVLAAFNMVPIPPLDGSRVLANFLPYNAGRRFDELERYGLIPVAVVLFLLPWATNGRIDIVRSVSRWALALFSKLMF